MNSGWTWMRDWSVKYYLLRENASKMTEAISLSSILKDSEETVTECGEIQSHHSG